MNSTVVWFRQDLRLQDNPALRAAVDRGGPVVPLFIVDNEAEQRWPSGGASRWWLHHSLAALAEELRRRGSRLILAEGETLTVLREVVREVDADALYWNRRYEPAAVAVEAALHAELGSTGVVTGSFNGSLLHEPTAITNKQGRPFQVFTPFWRHCLTLPVTPPVVLREKQLPTPRRWPKSLPLEQLALRPRIRWDLGLQKTWLPGEATAAKRLRSFSAKAMESYGETRNLPSVDGTAMLSPHLHFGEVSPRQIWATVREVGRTSGVFPPSKGAGIFLSEVGWREFAYHLLFHFPHTPEKPLREGFARFPWSEDPAGESLRAWQRGRTGYPIVDAGMRQLWHTGWMHNRVRMIVGSFLVKHLRLPWNAGAAWFWDTLVDADLANNTLGWQWVAGCGADASPYFRIFAPVLQGRKFDPDGVYVRRWVPELSNLRTEFIHAPWEAPAAQLTAAGIELGKTYPPPIVDHVTARNAALAALKTMRQGAGDTMYPRTP